MRRRGGGDVRFSDEMFFHLLVSATILLASLSYTQLVVCFFTTLVLKGSFPPRWVTSRHQKLPHSVCHHCSQRDCDKKLKRSILLRDHSLGRDYLFMNEVISLQYFLERTGSSVGAVPRVSFALSTKKTCLLAYVPFFYKGLANSTPED